MIDLEHGSGLALARAAARRGGRFLDSRAIDWVNEIDVTRLDLRSTCNCVLGQLYGDYHVGANRLFLTEEQAVKLGFYAPPGVVALTYECEHGHEHGIGFGGDYSFEELTDAWREEIQQRRCATRGRIVVDSHGTAEVPALV